MAKTKKSQKIEKEDSQGTQFTVTTESWKRFKTQKILLTTGLLDILPSIPGFKECWGQTIIHCPYCDGYENKNCNTALVADGELALEMLPLINSWTENLTLITHGSSILNDSKIFDITKHKIPVIEKVIQEIHHSDWVIESIEFTDGTKNSFEFLYARPPHKLHSTLAQDIGCEIMNDGRIWIDENHKTSIDWIFAAGDNSYSWRSLAQAIANGSSAAMSVNWELLSEEYKEV